MRNSGKRKATDDRDHTRTAKIDSREGAGENIDDNDHDLDSDVDTTSSGSQVLISQVQRASAEKQEDSRFKRRKTAKFKKHPDAPKRFRSAFIIFSQHRHKQLRAKLNAEGGEIDTMNIAGQISDEWRNLKPDAKRKWDEMARKDKERYQREKAEYAGPWKVRTNLRKPKDPNSPKKPVPAYFAFSNERRQEVKNSHPSATNGEVSRLLSKMWKDAPEEVRKFYLDREAQEREKYTESMTEWKAKRRREDAKQAFEETSRVDSGEAHKVEEEAKEKDIAVQQKEGFNSGANNINAGVSFRAPAPFVHQSQELSPVVGDGREDAQMNHSAASSSYDTYSRLLHEQRLSQELLGAILLQQQSQAAPTQRDTGSLLQLLSRIQTPSQHNFGNGDYFRQLMTSALHANNLPNMNTDGDQHLLGASNLTNSSAGNAGVWLGGRTIPPAGPSNMMRQNTRFADPTLDNVLNLLKRQQTSAGFGIRNGWIDESSLRQLVGGVGGSLGQSGLIHSSGHTGSAIPGASGFTPESTILLRMLQQQRIGEAASGSATFIGDASLQSSSPSSNLLQDLMQQIGEAVSRGSGRKHDVARRP